MRAVSSKAYGSVVQQTYTSAHGRRNYQHRKRHEVNTQRTRKSATRLIHFNAVLITTSTNFRSIHKNEYDKITQENATHKQRTGTPPKPM
jgi:hypothetical protein